MHASNNDISKKIILIVDDDDVMKTLVRGYFTDRGLDINEAENGEEALNFYHKSRPDLIITDINMPVMNGLAFIRRVRQTDRSIPIIAASTDNTLLNLALIYGANEIFSKLSGVANLIEIVSSLMQIEKTK